MSQKKPAMICAELMKCTRLGFVPVREISGHVGVHPDTVRDWAAELEEVGILKARSGRPNGRGPAAVEYALSSKWGGL